MASQRLSVYERLTMVGGLVAIAVSLAVGTVTSIFRKHAEPPAYKLRLLFKVLRSYTRFLSARQIQAIAPGTEATYKSFAAKSSVSTTVARFEDGSEGYWFGTHDSGVVLLFLHGGGYATPATIAHFKLLEEVVSKAQQRNISLGALLLKYDLAPGAQYPSQLQQAVHAYKHCVEKLGYSPANIILAGDSAGGHLALGLLSSLSHPREDIPTVASDDFLRATMLISPWVTFDLSANAMMTNRLKDCLYPPALKNWSEAFLGIAPLDNYNYPLGAEKEWWNGLKTKDLCVVAGSDEVFVGDIAHFVERLKEFGVGVEYHLMEDEPHDAMIFNTIVGLPDSASKKLFCDWVLSRAT